VADRGASPRPGTITGTQRLAIVGLFDAAGIRNTWQRAFHIAEILHEEDWQHGGDLGWLSEAQAQAVITAMTRQPPGPGELTSGPAWDAP
jgi:hypothetical protein